MNKTKKLIALALSVVLVVTSMAFAISAIIGDGNGSTVNVTTKFYRLDGSEWVETQKIAPGDVVKMRLFYETDFFTGAGISFVTYDNAFFSDSYGKSQWITTVNSEEESDAAKYGIHATSLTVNTTATSGSQIYKKLMLEKLITQDYCNTHNGFFTVYEVRGSENCVKFDGDCWMFEYDLTVKTGLGIDATGTGYVDPAYYATTKSPQAASEVTKGSSTTPIGQTAAGFQWDATPTVAYDTLSVDQYVNFDANGGVFDGNVETMKLHGIIKESFHVSSIPTPYRAGYTFVGWIDSQTDASDATEADVYENVPVDYEETTYKALWKANNADDVTISFNANGGTFGNGLDTYEVKGATGSAYVQPEEPTRAGYSFDGWSATLPDTIPVENTVISAKWKIKEITVTFTYGDDTTTSTGLYNESLSAPSIDVADGYELIWYANADFSGDPVTFPTTYPAENAAYYAKLSEKGESTDTPIKLIPAAGKTTVVDRNGYTETIEDFDGIAGTDYTAYEDSTDTEKAQWFIYGLGERLNESRLLSYVDYTGDGRLEVVPCTVLGGTADGYGTGAVINLYDAKGTADDTTDDTLVESFVVVIFGDVNGDARVTNTDVTLTDTEVAGASEERWGRGQIPYRFKAGNVNGDSRITNTDASMIASVVAGSSSIDQTTGNVS